MSTRSTLLLKLPVTLIRLRPRVAGLLSRIVVRKAGRRAAEGKPSVPVRAADGGDAEGGGEGAAAAAAAAADNGDVSALAGGADVAREQFPFIFNLLRGHAVSARELGPRAVSADNRRSKTSQHQQQQQQLQPARKPAAAVATCRQRQTSRGGTPASVRSFSLSGQPSAKFFN